MLPTLHMAALRSLIELSQLSWICSWKRNSSRVDHFIFTSLHNCSSCSRISCTASRRFAMPLPLLFVNASRAHCGTESHAPLHTIKVSSSAWSVTSR